MKKLLLLVAVLALLTPALAQQAGLKATFDSLWIRIADGESIALNLIRAAGDSWAAMPKWWIMQYADSAAGAGLVIYRGYGFADSLTLIATGDTVRLDSALIAGGGGGTTDSFKLYYGLLSTASDSWLRPDSAVWLDTTTLDSRYSVTDKFTHNDPADSSETLYAKSAVIDTTAPRAGNALTVAGNAWVRDTVQIASATTVGVLVVEGKSNAAIVLRASAQGHAGDAYLGTGGFAFTDSAGADTIAELNVGTATMSCWRFQSVDSTEADTSYMSRTLGFYTNTAAGFVGPGAVVPGTVIDWYGDSSAFPTGYVLCDGTRKFKTAAGDSLVTPDLRNFFVVGASIDTGNGIPMSSIEDTTGTTAKATGGSQKYTPAGAVSAHTPGGGNDFNIEGANDAYAVHDFTGSRAVLVQPYVACWKLVKSRTY